MLTWAVGCTPAAGMGNVLSAEKRQQVIALGRLGWSLRRIEEATGVRRETASTYLRAAGVVVRPPGRWGQPPKPAIEVSTDSGAGPASNPANGIGVSTDSPAALPLPRPGRSPAASACEPYRELIATALARGRNAMAIWQDLVDAHGFPATYASVMRFVRQLRGAAAPEAHAVIQTAPGEEGQVDYGDGPMVRHPATGKYRRTRLFLLTLGYSRKSVRLLTWQSSTRIWAELHERAFRRLGGAPALIVLDNLREGVLRPDVYEPTLNPLYRDVLAHYGVTALPCRVGDPGRIGHDVAVQWDERVVRILDPETGALLREHERQHLGQYREHPDDRPRRTLPTTLQLLARAATIGPHVGQLATTLHADDALRAVRRIQGLLALARKYGAAAVDAACAVALDLGPTYQFVRRYLERHPPAPLTLRQVDPLIRQLTLYRDLLQGRAPQEGDDDDAAP